MESVALPLFVTVTVWAALLVPTACEPKAMDAGETDTAGVEDVPVPVKATDVGLPAALVERETAAVVALAAVGVNVTEIVQCALAARELPQVVVSA